MIDISGLDKAELLAALYNGSMQFGMGFLHVRGQDYMTVEQASAIIAPEDDDKRLTPWEKEDARRLYFDYVYGRVLKVDLSKDTMDSALYNRDVGTGAAERIVAALRAKHGK